MAQVNNPNGNQKIEHSWSFKSVAKKDLNGKQWPFKVVRDEGKPTKMEARSITDLNKSFEGTSYNFNSCPTVKSRYTLLYEVFSNKYSEVTNRITHLLFTYDSIYFKLNDENEVRGCTFANNILKPEDLNGLISGILYKTKWLDENVKKAFQVYQENNDEVYRNQLVKEVQFYLNVRKKIRVIDNIKPMIDVLKSELSFASLQYLIFVPYPNIAKDYQASVIDGLLRNNIDPDSFPKIKDEVERLLTLTSEMQAMEQFKGGLERKEYCRSIRKFYMLSPRELNKETVWNLFKSITSNKLSVQPVYISEAELVRQKRVENDSKVQLEEKMKRINDLRSSIRGTYSEVIDILFIMNSFAKMCDLVHQSGAEVNNVEYSIWINQYDIVKIKTKIEGAYTYRKNRDSAGSSSITVYPISKIFKLIQENIGVIGSVDLDMELQYFNNNIVPSGFKNDTLGLTNFGIEDLNSENSLKNLKKIIEDIKLNFMYLFEVFLGVQYATFGVFMKRYGVVGLMLSKMLVPDLVNKYSGKAFNMTENVKENANIAFYITLLGIEDFNRKILEGNDETKGSLDTIKKAVGPFTDFVIKYLDEISGVKTPNLQHSGVEEENARYINLMAVSHSISNILSVCQNLVHLDVNSDENRKMLEVIEKNNK